jgi:PII interaction protein X
MASERYLNHPTFGMFFLVTLQPRGAQFEVIPYGDARHHAEVNISRCRRDGSDDLVSWRQLFDQTFI